MRNTLTRVRKRARARFDRLRNARALARVPRLDCDPARLRRADQVDLAAMFRSPGVDAEWEHARRQLDAVARIPDGTGGVNPGDRRALYYLIRHFKPGAVLEIGTHVGASTLYMALALKRAVSEGRLGAGLVTVDRVNVNDPSTRYWERYGALQAPAAAVAELGCEDIVRFVTAESLDYMERTAENFDLVFLDGSHAADATYREIAAATQLLSGGDVIVLHDYFPGGQPLWEDGAVIPGPWLAVERLRQEGEPVRAVPLGELPWSTKQRSHQTSLALLLREG